MTHLPKLSYLQIMEKLQIGVVDDNEPFRKGICALLHSRGFSTCAFGSVREFIEGNVMQRISCLILDIGLPEIDGIAFQECLAQTNFRFPVIFCTGYEVGETQASMKEGVFAVLHKPVDPDLLINTVQSACGLSVN